jgi:hypothetical protein
LWNWVHVVPIFCKIIFSTIFFSSFN